MPYSAPKILLLAIIGEPLMASPEDGGWNGELELPPVPVGSK